MCAGDKSVEYDGDSTVAREPSTESPTMPKCETTPSSHLPPVNRRRFLGMAATAGAATFAAPALLRGRNLNEKLNIAVVGTGGRGASNMQAVASENIVALCDVNADHLGRAAAAHPQARRCDDFRRLYDQIGRAHV